MLDYFLRGQNKISHFLLEMLDSIEYVFMNKSV
jgi:hypothetical protein